MSFIVLHQSIRNSDTFCDLPENLKMEIEKTLDWDVYGIL